MFNRVPLIVVTLLCLFVVNVATADVIVRYEFTGDSTAFTSKDANVTASSFVDNGGNLGAGFAHFTQSGNPAPALQSRNVDIPNTSATADDYFTFTITPGDNYKMSLTNLTFDMLRTGGTGAANVTLFLTSDAGGDNFATTIGSNQVTTTSWSTRTIDLSAATFQDMANAITFRIYAFDGGSNATGSGLHLDNVTVNGTVSLIPEPASLALMGLGGLLMLGRGRRA